MSDHLNSDSIRFGFTGDVMIARAIDAILPIRTDGTLHEPCMKHADEYVQLAEQQNGALDQDEITEKGYSYIWGNLIEELGSMPDYLVVNLETSLTTCEDWTEEKGIHYRAHPKNVEVLEEIGVRGVATLANNHVLDWGIGGLSWNSVCRRWITCTSEIVSGEMLRTDTIKATDQDVHVQSSCYWFPIRWGSFRLDCIK